MMAVRLSFRQCLLHRLIFQHGEDEGRTEFHGGFRGQWPTRLSGNIRLSQALRAKRSIIFLRGTPCALRILRVENAEAKTPPVLSGVASWLTQSIRSIESLRQTMMSVENHMAALVV